MKSFRRHAFLGAGILVLALAISSTDTPSAFAQGMKALLVRNVDAPAARPFQASLCLPVGFSCDGEPNEVSVPTVTAAGETVQRLVIEYASMECRETEQRSVHSAALSTTAGGVRVTHRIVPVAVPMATGYRNNAAQDLRLYADPASDVTFFVDSSGSATVCRMSISGHFTIE